MKRWIRAALIGAAILGLVTLGVSVLAAAHRREVAQEHRCREAGGTVEKRNEGIQIVHIGGRQYPRTQHSTHCWIDGREVNP